MKTPKTRQTPKTQLLPNGVGELVVLAGEGETIKRVTFKKRVKKSKIANSKAAALGKRDVTIILKNC